ncbi:MAG: cysteine desulfurase / selenocysteine lyase [Parcubacteria group bacterium Gr01-1014_29]|nr:MAG: cysteine desulfurase / selenocysteine lyase [Parcubacteria group bacterium Gr01-1014_29]
MRPDIKTDFPLFQAQSDQKPLVFLDNAAASQMPKHVLDAITEYYTSYKANVHSGIYTIGRRAVEAYENSRAVVARFIGAQASEIIFTSGTTASLNMLMRMLEDTVNEGDEVIVSGMEHHSNFIPWQELCKKRGARFTVLPLLPDGTLSLDIVRSTFSDKTKIIAITHVSHVTGTVNDVKEICRIAREKGAYSIIDGAQSAPHMRVDVREMGCDFFAFSGQKMLGPTGIGVLFGKKECLEKLEPSGFGGGMIRTVKSDISTWADAPAKFEAGTPHIAGAIGLAEAIRYIENVGGVDEIHAHECMLAAQAREMLGSISEVTLYGPKDSIHTAGIVSFTLNGVHPHDVAEVLARENIAVRAGHHCALPLMAHFGIPGTVRASFYLYNTKEDVRRLVEGVQQVISLFHG